jgi:hypothetical protein
VIVINYDIITTISGLAKGPLEILGRAKLVTAIRLPRCCGGHRLTTKNIIADGIIQYIEILFFISQK